MERWETLLVDAHLRGTGQFFLVLQAELVDRVRHCGRDTVKVERWIRKLRCQSRWYSKEALEVRVCDAEKLLVGEL